MLGRAGQFRQRFRDSISALSGLVPKLRGLHMEPAIESQAPPCAYRGSAYAIK